jgi:hypothetical protein
VDRLALGVQLIRKEEAMTLPSEIRQAIRLVCCAAALCLAPVAQAQDTAAEPAAALKQRDISGEEQGDLSKRIREGFPQTSGKEVKVSAAGPFRFAATEQWHYMDRSDTESVAFEDSGYGIGKQPLDAAAIQQDSLLPHLEAAMLKAGLNPEGKRFLRFQDEFSASAEPRLLPPTFDPSKAGTHVARTAFYERMVEGVPVFGSELIVGLLPDGSIGRLRMHWPKVDPQFIDSARVLQKMVQSDRWKVPPSLHRKETKILEVSAGVGHSGIATPGFKMAPVVRVLYRTQSRDRKYPLQTTGYKYFDERGHEVRFDSFPRVSATPAARKPKLSKAAK